MKATYDDISVITTEEELKMEQEKNELLYKLGKISKARYAIRLEYLYVMANEIAYQNSMMNCQKNINKRCI